MHIRYAASHVPLVTLLSCGIHLEKLFGQMTKCSTQEDQNLQSPSKHLKSLKTVPLESKKKKSKQADGLRTCCCEGAAGQRGAPDAYYSGAQNFEKVCDNEKVKMEKE